MGALFDRNNEGGSLKKDLDAIKAELREIQLRHPENLIAAEDVVEFARNKRTALHSRFTWDNDVAAQRYRIIQARVLIQELDITIERDGKQITHRAVVSLLPDRLQPGGGYRFLEDVLSDPEKRQQYLETALSELEALQRKYKSVKELAPVFDAVERIRRRAESKRALKAVV
jgi:hypothetical protein